MSSRTYQRNRILSSALPVDCEQSDGLGFDFALLGLRANESRVSVIRRAAKQTAARIGQLPEGRDVQVEMRAQLAKSTYRLLDPRRRRRPNERVQLCVFSEEDLDAQKRSRSALLEGNSKSGSGSVLLAELVA